MMHPEPLSADAVAVAHELADLAREYPDASGPELVAMLAKRWCPARLKKGEWHG